MEREKIDQITGVRRFMWRPLQQSRRRCCDRRPTIALALSADRPCCPLGTPPVSVCRRGFCPSDRISCPLVFAACFRPRPGVVVPVNTVKNRKIKKNRKKSVNKSYYPGDEGGGRNGQIYSENSSDLIYSVRLPCMTVVFKNN